MSDLCTPPFIAWMIQLRLSWSVWKTMVFVREIGHGEGDRDSPNDTWTCWAPSVVGYCVVDTFQWGVSEWYMSCRGIKELISGLTLPAFLHRERAMREDNLRVYLLQKSRDPRTSWDSRKLTLVARGEAIHFCALKLFAMWTPCRYYLGAGRSTQWFKLNFRRKI